jgi:hypothetical protein
MNRSYAWLGILGASVAVAMAGGCGGASSGATGAGGKGTGASSSSTGPTTTSSSGTGTGGMGTSSSTTSSSTGGTGGDGGAGGGTGGACLDASDYVGTFAIVDTAFCAVAVYTANEALSSSPSWGTHGGPLAFVADAAGGGVTLERWTAPAAAMGGLTRTTTHVAAGAPSGALFGAQANDLPFFGWTALSWTGPSPSTAGQVVLVSGGSAGTTYPVNGVLALAGVSDGAGQGRVLYTGLSPLGAPTTTVNGLYAADACSTPTPALGAGQGCATSTLVDAWDEYPGPVAVNKNGDAFVVLTSASAGTQEARGYAAVQVRRGAPAVEGATLFTVGGTSGALAALAPTAGASGLVVFQPFDFSSGEALDVIEQAYSVSGGVVAASGNPTTLLHVPSGSTTGYPFFTDGMDRLWVAVSGATSTTYVVLVRQP